MYCNFLINIILICLFVSCLLFFRSMFYVAARNLRLCSKKSCTARKAIIVQKFYSDKSDTEPDFKTSTIIVENNLNVQELPVIIRNVKDLSFLSSDDVSALVDLKKDNINYNLIKTEFTQCPDLRDVFSLLSKCIKITPEIALGAIERINELEKMPNQIDGFDTRIVNANVAKDAILEKLMKIIITSEDNKILLSVLSLVSPFIEPYRNKFSDELLLRSTDSKLSIEELCMFITYLTKLKTKPSNNSTIDKLWVGFFEKEQAINEENVVQIFQILPFVKTSRRTLVRMLEKKLENLWYKINPSGMLEIINIAVQNIYLSERALSVIGRWLNTNIHVIDEDFLLEFITRLTKLNYTDDQIQKAIERYVKMRIDKIQSQVLVVSILNHCVNFNIVNKNILNGCCEYFLMNAMLVSHTLLKSMIYPFGYLFYNPSNEHFWPMVEEVVLKKFSKINKDDILSIVLGCIYVGIYPLKLVDKVFSPQSLGEINLSQEKAKLMLIDTALSLECSSYTGPHMPKDQWPKTVSQDSRIQSLISSVKDTFESIAGGSGKISTPQLVPHIVADETYLIDVMLHTKDLKNEYNWKLKSEENTNIAILIHLPEHYCYNSDQLIGPQMMRKKHIKLLGFKVVSLKYSTIHNLKSNKIGLTKYLENNITK